MSVTSALSTPAPANAAIRCSTVETVTPARLPITVQCRVSTTACHNAGMVASCARASVRRNTTP